MKTFETKFWQKSLQNKKLQLKQTVCDICTTDCHVTDQMSQSGAVSRVRDLGVFTEPLTPSGSTSRSALNITWTMPEAYDKVEGFVVRVQQRVPDGPEASTTCYIINTTVDWKQEQKDMKVASQKHYY